METQEEPAQHAVVAQLAPFETHRSARALGLSQAGTVLPASPVQKQEAWAKFIQVYAAQYGVSAVRPGSDVAPGGNAGMQTLPSS
jgi:hypothetical protein